MRNPGLHDAGLRAILVALASDADYASHARIGLRHRLYLEYASDWRPADLDVPVRGAVIAALSRAQRLLRHAHRSPDPLVRLAVASNPATGATALQALLGDPDEDVRAAARDHVVRAMAAV